MPVFARPSADGAITGPWTTNTGATSNLYAAIGETVRDDSTYIRTQVNPIVHRVFFVGTDDERKDTDAATLKYTSTSGVGYRALERCKERYCTDLVAKGLSFLSHRVTKGPCWTGRAEWHTGNRYPNHGVSVNSHTNFSTFYFGNSAANKTTISGNPPRATAQWMGPWAIDLAAQAGYADEYVTRAQMVTDGALRDSDDHLQAFSGGLFSWLGAHAKIGAFGKMQNGMVVTDLIMPGINRASIQIVGDSAPNYYSSTWAEFDDTVTDAFEQSTPNSGVANPFDGDGVTPDSNTYQYGDTITGITWVNDSGRGGEERCACSNAHGLQVGDLVGIKCTGTAAFQNYSAIVSNVESNTVFRTLLASDPGVSGSGTKTYYNRRRYPTLKSAFDIIAWLETLDDADDIFTYWCPHAPHDTSDANWGSDAEQMYADAVDINDAMMWNGVAGAWSPVSTNPSGTQNATDFKFRHELLASVDDGIGMIIDYAEARWGADGFSFIYTSDQGEQQGEQTARGDGGVKTAVWEGSASPMLVMRGPQFPQGETFSSRPTCHADVPLTILDLFGLTFHHAHTTRDGVSLLRLFQEQSAHASWNRACPVWGDYKGATGAGFVDQFNQKWMNNGPSGTTSFWFDPLFDPLDANSYEVTQTTSTGPDRTAQLARLASLVAARFDPVTATNTAHTA